MVSRLADSLTAIALRPPVARWRRRMHRGRWRSGLAAV